MFAKINKEEKVAFVLTILGLLLFVVIGLWLTNSRKGLLFGKRSMKDSLMTVVNIEMNKDHTEQDGDWIETAEALHEAQLMKKHFAAIELKLLNQLKNLSGNESSKGGNFVFTCKSVPSKINYKLVEELEGVDLEPYRKPRVKRWKLTKI